MKDPISSEASPADSRANRYITAFLLVTAFAVAFLYLLRPITDPDFFWHLKTDEWI
jgi:hypothetical protein